MNQSAFLQDIADLLEVGIAELNQSYELNEDNFDSVAVVSTIALIDEHFDLTVKGRELANVKSIGELLALINKAKEQV